MLLDPLLGFGVDHRADVHRQALWITETAFSHSALEHFDNTVCAIFLQAQHTQCRAALTCAVKGRRYHVDDHLFGQRRGVNDQGVLAAGFGDQRDRTSLAIHSTSDIAL
ncbi:hypothetical protein D3C75_697930 [compost metagenome]